jgi:hypothetical protein
VSKQPVNEMDRVRLNVTKLNEGEVREQYEVTIRNRFSSLENVEDNWVINRVWVLLERT